MKTVLVAFCFLTSSIRFRANRWFRNQSRLIVLVFFCRHVCFTLRRIKYYRFLRYICNFFFFKCDQDILDRPSQMRFDLKDFGLTSFVRDKIPNKREIGFGRCRTCLLYNYQTNIPGTENLFEIISFTWNIHRTYTFMSKRSTMRFEWKYGQTRDKRF